MSPRQKPKTVMLTLWERLASGSLGDYLKDGGYDAGLKVARRGGREVIRIMRDAGMRTLDGAGDMLFTSWQACQTAPAEHKYVVCVTEDPDANAPIYESIMRRSPHAIIEGLICGALAVGAHEGFIYLHEDHYELISIMESALSDARGEGLVGEDALLDLRLVTGSRSVFCWRPENQLAYIEELIQRQASVARGFSLQGLFGWPSVNHDPETWATVPAILAYGPKWYRELGRGVAGTKLVYLAGGLNKPGLYEVPMGIPISEILQDYGGGTQDGVELKAVQFGGSAGGFLPSGLLDAPFDFEVLAENGISMNSGGMEVVDDSICMSARTLELAYRCLGESCGENSECSGQLNRLKRLLGEVEEGRGTSSHLPSLQKIGTELYTRTASGGQRSVARPLLTALAYFRYDFIHHIEQGVCATGARKGLSTAPCQAACPAGIDIPTYLTLVAQGRHEEAIAIIREDNPLPWICGIICTHPCEMACTRGEMDSPLAIMAMKGYAAEQCMLSGGYPQPSVEPLKDEKVAVVGSGPAGLSAAYFLARKGYKVTVFEALPVAGGVLSVGIPEYRLPIAVVQQEIDAILSLGVELKTGIRVGRDITLDELREQGYKAFFLGLGAHEGYKLGIEGELELGPVSDVMGFLRHVRMGRKTPLADKVVVVGGGNAAIDAARTCVRLGSSEVYIAYRRTRKEMPAWEEEIVQAEEEGVKLSYLTIPKRIVGEQGKVSGLECLEAELGEPDASGRRRPVPKPDSEYIIEVGAVIAAIGQQPDVTCLQNTCELTVNTRSRIVVDKFTLQSNMPDVFSGGDVVTGPATVVQAVGAGKWAARSIDAYLQGEPIPMGEPAKEPRARLEPLEQQASEKVDSARAKMPLLDMEKRTSTFKRVELGLNAEQAANEGLRCLRCDLCVGCGLCQAVCEEMGVRGLHLSATSEGRLALTDFHRPARSCIGCGSCVQVCPHKNIRMRDEGDHRHITFCGTQTAKLELKTCEGCGEVLAPEAYLTYLRRMVSSSDSEADLSEHRLCPDCARKRWAKGQMGDALWFPPSS
jgi:NADH-quinone oxidoreductase subunit F